MKANLGPVELTFLGTRGDQDRHGLVRVHGSLGAAGRAAGEVQQRHVFGGGPYLLERFRRLRHRGRQIDCTIRKVA